MKTNTFSIAIILALILALSLASAFDVVPSASTITFTSSGLQTLTLSGDLFNLTSNTGSLNFGTSLVTLTTVGATQSVTSLNVNVSAGSFSSLAYGTHTQTAYFNVTDATNASLTKSIPVSIVLKKDYNICSASNPGELEVSSIEISVDGFGDDEDYWYPLDKVEITFDVENNGDSDISNVEITACLFDVKAEECVMDEDDMDISDDGFDIDKGDDTSITINLDVDPGNLEAGNNDYTLYIGATGEVDDSDSSFDGNDTCAYKDQDIEIRTDEQFVVLDNIIVPEDVSCGASFDITADVWNIGDQDLDSDEVFIVAYNQELNINKKIELSNDLDSFEKQRITIPITIPSNAVKKTYGIELSVYEDEDVSDSDIYQNSEDDDASFTALLVVANCNPTSTSNASTITVELSEDTPRAMIGEQVIVEATITNSGTTSITYNIEVTGNSAWSQVADIDPETFTLAAGATKKVLIYLDINEDAETGEQEFTIKATYGSVVKEQKVRLTLESGLSKSAIINHLKQNWFIYTIILVNIILIIAIILVVKSIVSRDKR